MKSYLNFVLMIAVSATLIHALMYFNTYELGHVRFSQTRLFMTLIMAGNMALVMLFFMRHMYKNRAANLTIVGASLAPIAGSVWLVRSQATVEDVAWMKAISSRFSARRSP